MLGEAHVPLLSGHSVRLPLDLDLLQPQRIFPLPLPAGQDAEIRWISASTFSGDGWRAGGPSVMHPCYNTKSSQQGTANRALFQLLEKDTARQSSITRSLHKDCWDRGALVRTHMQLLDMCIYDQLRPRGPYVCSCSIKRQGCDYGLWQWPTPIILVILTDTRPLHRLTRRRILASQCSIRAVFAIAIRFGFQSDQEHAQDKLEAVHPVLLRSSHNLVGLSCSAG